MNTLEPLPHLRLVCCVCGSLDWFSCAPGTEAENRIQGNVCILNPAPAIKTRAWCLAHLVRHQAGAAA